MSELIGDWKDKVVSVALRLGGGYYASPATMLEGKLVQVAETGIVLELPKGKTFVPVSAIVHIRLLDGR